MAFANRPRLIVLDEPTTGLDVTTQAHGAVDGARARSRARRRGASTSATTSPSSRALARRVAVMYAGRVVELGLAEELFESSAHPYTRRLVGAIPRLTGGRSLLGIPGHAPSPGRRPPGCASLPAARCTSRECDADVPPLLPVGPEHSARCIRAREVVTETQATSR
ncbi:MAG: oligopeptide/dipeptide ABC transporter ATP-binding protein [Nocardioidaceae bacterium]